MGRLGIILSQFPRYDEAFILRELVALAQGPQKLVIFSLRPCRDAIIHEQAKSLQRQTVYAPFLWSANVWRSHGWFVRHCPRAYWGSLAWIFSRHWNHPVILAKSLLLFPKTVHFARIALEHQVAHLHAGWATYPAASALIISRLTGIPYSLSGHAHDIYTTNPTLVEKMRGARFVVTCTEENKRHLEQLMNGVASLRVSEFARLPESVPTLAADQLAHGLTRQRADIVVSYHGVDLARFAPAPKPDTSTCRLLVVGSLLPCKGLETLIEGCRLLKERAFRFECTIAGGGPLERSLRTLIRRYELDEQVRITGHVSQETVAGLYQQAHLFILPLVSRIHWGIPNVVIEALATKTPVVCCNLPSLKELVEHGETGWIIPEQDPGAIAQAIQTLWTDAALRTQLAEAGYRRAVERFALERTGARLRELFANAQTNGRIGTTVPVMESNVQ